MNVLRALLCVVAIWMASCNENPKADLGEEPVAKDIVAEVQSIQNANTDFQITVRPERESGKYKIGEEIGLIFTSNKDAYVNIIDIGASGKAHMIFPNAWHTSNKVEKGKTYRIPPKDAGFIFRVTPPPGTDFVKVIATLNKPDCVKEKYLEPKGQVYEIKEALLAIKDIQAELQKIDAKQWTEASTQITIEEGKQSQPSEQPLKPIEETRPPKPQGQLKSLESPDSGAKDIVAAAQKIRNDTKPVNVKLWIEADRTSFKTGEAVTFHFTADHDCYVTLIDIGTSGKVHQIFPNKWQESNKVEKGKTYAIPPAKSDFVFKVSGPGGTEYVKAIATLKPIQALGKAQMEPKGAFAEIKDAGLVLKDIAMELAEQDVRTWAEAEASFKIVAVEGPLPSVATAPARPSVVSLSTDKQTYKVGEPISFTFQTARDCYLTLIDIGSSGKVHIIFPNKFNRDNAMKAGIAHKIPSAEGGQALAYKIVSPPGTDTIKAICTFQPCKLLAGELSYDDQAFPTLGTKEEVIKQIRDALAKLEPAAHAETEVAIQVVPYTGSPKQTRIP